jgi:hypothetical protein
MGTRSTFSQQTGTFALNKIYLKRGLNPPNLSSFGTVDFNGTDAFDPDNKQITLNGANAGENVTIGLSFTTSTGTTASLSSFTSTTSSVTNVFSVPSAKTITGDYHTLTAIATTNSGNQTSAYRDLIIGVKDPSAQSYTLGPVQSTPTVSVLATAPYVRMRTVFAVQPEYPNLFFTAFAQAGSGSLRSANIVMWPGYLGGGSTFDVSIPDFTSTAGWQNVWGMQPGATTIWQTQASGFIAGNGNIFDGSLLRAAGRQSTVVP